MSIINKSIFMRKKRILIQTNPPWIKTGLAEAGRNLMRYLYATNKYELAWYCTQVSESDPNLLLTPWKSYGALPSNPQAIQELNQDPGKARDASYGSWNIDKVVKDFKPDAIWGADDIWSFPSHAYMNKPWWNQINSILHITVDSLPVLEQAFEQAKLTKHYYTWAKFASKEMHRMGSEFSHVKQIYGGFDTQYFHPIAREERNKIRQKFGINSNTIIFNYIFRNQLRKRVALLIKAFAEFKRENPLADVKLHLHTCFGERNHGWDIPKLMSVHGVKQEDVLATYVCKKCGTWHIGPYVGEDVNCPYCKGEKTMCTASITNGVPVEDMKYIHGISDAGLSPHNSAGLELFIPQTLLCGQPIACTNYASGEDFCEQDFVFPLSYTQDNEPGTNFIKAVPSTEDMKKFMKKVWRMSPKELKEWGQKGRDWAVKTFSIETIGAQWEALFDSLPLIDWDKVNLTSQIKNDQYPFPEIEDEDQFITALYTNILKMDEPPNGEGRKHWAAQLKNGMKRQDVYNYFISVAKTENQKNQVNNVDFASLLDNTGRKRILYLMKESAGDCLISTQLFQGIKEKYPEHDLYVATESKFFDIFQGNPYIHKLLQYQSFMEQEMILIGAGQSSKLFDVFLHPGILTQRQLFYLSA